MLKNIAQFLVDHSQLLVILFSGVSSSVAAIALIVSIINNVKTNIRYNNNKIPQLSMKLESFNNELFLLIYNSGISPAKNIKITLNNITNNGNYDFYETRLLFKGTFDLYPKEEVQDYISENGNNIIVDTFPTISISVEYKDNNGQKYSYTRAVTYCRAYNKKIYADVNLDTCEIETSIKSVSRNTTRMANYLDGKNLANTLLRQECNLCRFSHCE